MGFVGNAALGVPREIFVGRTLRKHLLFCWRKSIRKNKSVRKIAMNARYSQEIDRLYLQMSPMLFEYARSVLSNDALAEEAVQDTFIIACQKPEALCDSPNPKGWLFNTLKNVVSNTVRRQTIGKRIFLSYVSSNVKDVSVAPDRVDLEILYDDIADLEEFKLLKEMALEGKSYLEMAEERGITVSTCRKRVERAKKILQKKIRF